MKKEKTKEHNNFCVILFVSDVATLEYNLWARDQTFRKVDWTMPLARMVPHMDVDHGRREEGQGRERGLVGAALEVREGAGVASPPRCARGSELCQADSSKHFAPAAFGLMLRWIDAFVGSGILQFCWIRSKSTGTSRTM
uniref:Uncharacterized protein n=1 Tax=Triticum urartu TaxID=4572 RepID=A0A8R7TGI8_TRIUA